MQILEQTEIKLNWPDLNNLYDHPYPKHKRSPGIHVSDVLKKIAVKTKQLTESDIREEFAPLRVFLGLAWERACAGLYPDMVWQPGELIKDGIIGSRDGQSIIEVSGEQELAIEEMKFTAKSSRIPGGDKDTIRDITNDWLWRNQGLAYLAQHPEQPTLVRWHICYSRGNYDWKDMLTERYIRYLIRFSRMEIDGAWKMMLKYKRLI